MRSGRSPAAGLRRSNRAGPARPPAGRSPGCAAPSASRRPAVGCRASRAAAARSAASVAAVSAIAPTGVPGSASRQACPAAVSQRPRSPNAPSRFVSIPRAACTSCAGLSPSVASIAARSRSPRLPARSDPGRHAASRPSPVAGSRVRAGTRLTGRVRRRGPAGRPARAPRHAGTGPAVPAAAALARRRRTRCASPSTSVSSVLSPARRSARNREPDADGGRRLLRAPGASRQPAGTRAGGADARRPRRLQAVPARIARSRPRRRAVRLRDRFLFALLASTGMRIGQALSLRRVVALEWRIEIVPRPGSRPRARSNGGARGSVPVPRELIRLWSDYLHIAISR